jgi:hypothetical protein
MNLLVPRYSFTRIRAAIGMRAEDVYPPHLTGEQSNGNRRNAIQAISDIPAGRQTYPDLARKWPSLEATLFAFTHLCQKIWKFYVRYSERCLSTFDFPLGPVWRPKEFFATIHPPLHAA